MSSPPRPSRRAPRAPRRNARRRLRRRAPPSTTATAAFPHESIAALSDAATSPPRSPPSTAASASSSVHDVIVASSRLARGDASVAIGVNMHLVIAHEHRAPLADAPSPPATRGAPRLRRVAARDRRDGVVIAAADQRAGPGPHPPRRRRATRTDAGWRIDGRKIFCTMSPAATVLYTAVTFVDDDGVERYGYAQVPADAPGVTIHDDWDALGMRASGSHSVTFDGVELPARGAARRLPGRRRVAVHGAQPDRRALPRLRVARHRRERRRRRSAPLRRRVGEPTRGRAMLVAENAIELGAARATLARGALVDEHYAAHPTPTAPPRRSPRCSPRRRPRRRSSTRPATRIVDRALALSGGAGYLNGSRWRAPTATSAPAPSCTRSAPTAPTTSSPTSRSAAISSCTSYQPRDQETR